MTKVGVQFVGIPVALRRLIVASCAVVLLCVVGRGTLGLCPDKDLITNPMEDVMDDFTFEDFVALLGADCVADPADALEAWEAFQAEVSKEA